MVQQEKTSSSPLAGEEKKEISDASSSKSILPQEITDEMKQSYLDYSMSVIIGRALPDVRDGLKPVHRRVLYGMLQLGLAPQKPYRKSARIVGDVLGKFHPHGDSAVYDSLARMAQDFSLRYPLVDGQGNWGSIDGDSPAAMRYTEARLQKLAQELLQDLDKKTVKFVPNFDNSLKEPAVLPAKAPNLLINGSSGIAVGMATNIPPHNLKEVCDALIKLIDSPQTSLNELMEILPGPDFPTGSLILGQQGIRQAYQTGRGKILVRAKTEIEENQGNSNKKIIIIKEIPYLLNKSSLVEQIADLIRNKKIEGISDLRDESDREGIRVVIELKTGINPQLILNNLYQHTRLQETYGILLLALVNRQPKLLNLKSLMSEFIQHRRLVVRNRARFELKKAQQREHILAGLVIALDDIDKVVALIKASSSGQEAGEKLVQQYALTSLQAEAILEMKLQRLTSLEQESIKKEQVELVEKIKNLKEILADEKKILEIIKKELTHLKKDYGDDRRTQIIGEAKEIKKEALIKKEKVVITRTHRGYVKRVPLETYKEQKRGGKGIIATKTQEEDFVEDVFITHTHSSLLFFTNQGKVFWKKVYEVPQAGRTALGTPLINLIKLSQKERVTALIPVEKFSSQEDLFFVTQQGQVKKTALEEFSRPRQTGIKAITLKGDDNLVKVLKISSGQEVILASQQGKAIRFQDEQVSQMGRPARGVRGLKLSAQDKIVAAVVVDNSAQLLTISQKGLGKRTALNKYRQTNRSGKGIRNLKVTPKTGLVVSVLSVHKQDQIIILSKKGQAIKIPVANISQVGRNTQGVRLMRVGPGDQVVGAALINN